ncbi:MAG: extracellular solute-binding protein [Anaerolineales bacterium]|jgi:multiple sugar transport system substrate-binding protein
MLKKTLLVLILFFAIAVAACQPAAPQATQAPAEPGAAEPTAAEPAAAEPAVSELKILWAQWDPADYLQQIGNMYEQETGVKVSIIQEPWDSFYDRFSTEMAAKGDTWDMVVGDSQWLGQGSQDGWYVNMTDFLVGEGLADTVTKATLTYYGEYPSASGQYWAFPTEGDANGWAYRKDLFEDPDEMAAFEAEYGYPLDVPEDYDQFYDIANFFTRPGDGLYGVAIYGQNGYDALVMGAQNVMFSYGGRWQNPETNEVMGIVDSPENIAAVQMYRDLWACCQVPGMANAFFNEVNDAMISGQAAMGMNYFAFFPALVNEATNPDYFDKIGFFSNPKGPGGDQAAGLGGQGMSIVGYISPERQEASKDFIRWFAQEDVQAEWARLGGYTCNADVLATDEFLNATPFNPAFAETMGFVVDFWNIPDYDPLLRAANVEFGKVIIEGTGTAEEAMTNLAQEQDQILRDGGYIK